MSDFGEGRMIPPLHDHSILREGEWWACFHPERPGGPDTGVVYEERCSLCCIKARADLALLGDHYLVEAGDPYEPPVLLSHLADGVFL